jgi:hypothetical protein
MRPTLGHASTHARWALHKALAIALGVGVVLALTALAVLANAALLAMAACAAPEHFTLGGDRIEICNLVGEVRLVPGSGPRAEVFVIRGGRDGARLRIEATDANARVGDGRSQLRVLYPERHIVYPRLGGFSHTSLTVGSDGCLGSGGTFSLIPRRITVSAHGPGLEAWADLEVRVPPGRDIKVHLGVGEASASNVDAHLLLDVASATVRADGTRGSLSIDAGSGSVVVQRCRGDLVIDTGSGEVQVDDTNGGRLSIDTGSGQVTGSHIAADALSVDTGSGRVELAGVGARDIHVDTGSGGVKLGLERGPGSLLVDTGSGSVTIEGPADLSAAVKLETNGGSIESDYPLTLRHREEGSLEGTIGDGRGQIHVDTGSGAVRLKRR